MDDSESTRKLLSEIRDAQAESLAEYRRVAARSLELQEESLARQGQLGALYRRVVIAGAVILVPLIGLVLYLAALIL